MIFRIGVFLALTFALELLPGQQSAQVLASILEEKGIITGADRARIQAAGPEDAVRMIASLLRDKGVLTGAEMARVSTGPVTSVVTAAPVPPPDPGKGPVSGAVPVTAASKLPVTVYGTLMVNAFSNTSLTNNQDIPLFAGKQGTDPAGGDKNFGMTVRQSRFGLRYNGAKVGDATIGGVFEFDLFGGSASLPNGVGFDLFRTRLAYGRADWRNFSIVAGQDWSIFAPLNPTSLAGYAIPDLAASGNLWIRTPQIRAEMRHDFSDSSHLQFQIAAVDPNVGDNPSTLAEARTAGIGERGRFPGAESRVAWNDGVLSFGLSAHYGRGKNAGTIGTTNVTRGVDSWGIAADYTVPLGKRFNVMGEAYEGRALGLFSSALGESVNSVGTAGEHGVESRGGWVQGQANWTKQWQSNVSYGIDSIDAHQLAVGSRNKTQTYVSNLIYKWSPNVSIGLEWRRFLTDFRNQFLYDEIGNHVNLSLAFSF